MDILYVSCLCSKDKYNNLFRTSKIKPGQQVQKYHRLLVEGMIKNKSIKVRTLSALPVNSKNTSQKFIKGEEEKVNEVIYEYLPIINIPIIKNIYIFLTSFIVTLLKYVRNRDTIIVCDILNISVASGALLASKVFFKQSVGIVTDVPTFLTVKKHSISLKINNFILKKFTSYVFLTEEMNRLININKKPYTIIEGQVDVNMKSVENVINKKYDNKICIYSGGLQKIYGIKYLCEAFIKANIDKAELHIYGDGDFKDELKEICKTHKNIKYFGVVTNDIVIKEQLKATLLINPRPTNEEYTKYSFPSKNMEYMASGTPTLTTKLPGMPKEYYEYVYLIENEDIDSLSKTFVRILNKDQEELHRKGLCAKEFVLKEKNNVIQAEKIISKLFNCNL